MESVKEVAPNLTTIDSGRGHVGLEGGYRAKEPGLTRVRLKRDSEALAAFALSGKRHLRACFPLTCVHYRLYLLALPMGT